MLHNLFFFLFYFTFSFSHNKITVLYNITRKKTLKVPFKESFALKMLNLVHEMFFIVIYSQFLKIVFSEGSGDLFEMNRQVNGAKDTTRSSETPPDYPLLQI